MDYLKKVFKWISRLAHTRIQLNRDSRFQIWISFLHLLFARLLRLLVYQNFRKPSSAFYQTPLSHSLSLIPLLRFVLKSRCYVRSYKKRFPKQILKGRPQKMDLEFEKVFILYFCLDHFSLFVFSWHHAWSLFGWPCFLAAPHHTNQYHCPFLVCQGTKFNSVNSSTWS